jgi:cyclophilin family peptidyl-prolyl cis-trans isomerase
VARARLLDAVQTSPEGPALDAALYPFGRMEHAPEAFASRVIAAARGALGRKTAERIFAVRALGRCGREALSELTRVAVEKEFTAAERAEAARALALLGEAGRAAAAEALARVTPDAKDALAIMALGGDDFGVLSALIAAAGADVPKTAEPALFTLASLAAPGGAQVPASLARRLAEIRCGAAGALARGAYDAEVLKRCDVESSEPAERARLGALLRRPLAGERRALWRALTRSDHVRVREAALEAIAQHPELGDTARAALAEALATKKGGIVATAAEVIHAHPDRVLVLAESEKRAALDPNAPPPTDSPRRSIDPAVLVALKADADKTWSEDLIETRAAILDAAVSVSLPGARELAQAACKDRNATMRDRAAKALRVLGDAAPACAAPEGTGPAAREIDGPLAKPTRVLLQTDAGQLAIVFEPELAPIAATRFVGLVRAGFYNGIVVHRVVPGFVAQLGDPDGDGFGGSGQLLRCETSPVPFGLLDVGVALAGRDTGSSQLFVTLARYPHLDGEYARIGHAEGDWAALAEGDAIREAKVDE